MDKLHWVCLPFATPESAAWFISNRLGPERQREARMFTSGETLPTQVPPAKLITWTKDGACMTSAEREDEPQESGPHPTEGV
jgi:hypothetical protein